jgi:hypothetical protein
MQYARGNIRPPDRARRMSPARLMAPGCRRARQSAFGRAPAISLMRVRRAANNTNAILRGVPRYPAGTYDATEGAKYLIEINFLYDRYVYKFIVDLYIIFKISWLCKFN